ncbi:MAG: Rpn family recombination-promoting nuclease/putative transposase, partial [Treponema sp.]|nr:Rpn family recombination-promoting nuclease/putative transposase [Treponema sp.]
MNANREYKASVFSLLFGTEDTLRGLYEALEGVALPPDVPITINTLEDALFRTRINDISFEAGEKLVVIIEHQSTINPNMPLRLLSYITRIYEKITAGKKRSWYGKKG